MSPLFVFLFSFCYFFRRMNAVTFFGSFLNFMSVVPFVGLLHMNRVHLLNNIIIIIVRRILILLVCPIQSTFGFLHCSRCFCSSYLDSIVVKNIQFISFFFSQDIGSVGYKES